MYIKLPITDDEKYAIYKEYASKLEYVLPVLVTGFNPGFTLMIGKEYMESNRISFMLAHLILKSHNLHNESIEVYD